MPVDEPHRVVCHLDRLLEDRGMTLAALADAVGVTVVNLSVLKNNRAKAVRFSTITAICEVLQCELGEVLSSRAAGRDERLLWLAPGARRWPPGGDPGDRCGAASAATRRPARRRMPLPPP